ncbi:hypothetical protein Tco_1393774 [Tanacetum coccineum]
MTDCSLWEVIKNGNKVLKRTVGTVEQVYEPTTAEEKQDRRNEMKARATMLMALPNKDQLKFHSYQDAKLLMKAIDSEIMDQTFDRVQKLISQLEIQGEVINQEDMNLKLFRSLPSEWKTHALMWRNKVEIETINNTAYGVSTAHTQSSPTSGDNLSDVLGDSSRGQAGSWMFPRNQENKGRENNTRTITVETPTQNALIAQDRIGGYDWSYQTEEKQPTNYALMAFTSSGSSSSSDSEVRLRDNALDEYKMNLEKAKKERDQLKQTLEKFQNSSKSLNDLLESQVIDKFKTGLGYNAATAASPAVESFVNLSDKSGSDKGYHSVPPPLTGNFIPRKPDLTFIDEIVKSENMDVTTVVTPSNDKTVENKGVSNTVESNAVRMNNSSAPIIEDWNSDDESEIDYTVRPSTEKIKSIKTVRETDAPKQNKHHPRGNQRNWNNLMSQRLGSDFKMINKACFVCGSFEHLHYVCDKKVVRPVWNNSRRVNHKNFSNKMTHPHPKRSFVPQAVLTRTGKINTAGANVNTAGASINTVNRPINTAASTPLVNHPRPKSNAFKRGYSQSSRPFNRYYANKNSINVNTARVKNTTARDRAVVSENKGKGANVVKASACWVWKAKNSSASTTFKKYSYIDARGKSNTASPEVKTAGDFIEDIADETLVYIRRSATKGKDKGKEKMEEFELAMTKTKSQQEQERLGFEVAVRLQAELDKEERQRISIAEGLKRLRKVSSASRVESSNDVSLGAQEDASKQGRKIADLDADAKVTSIDEAQERYDEEMLFDVQDDLQGEEVVAEREVSAANLVTTAGEVVTTASATTTVDELTLAQTLIEIKAAKLKAVTTATTTITTDVASTRPKTKGKRNYLS